MENPKEEPKRTHYLDELPNIDKDTLAKMWEATIPRVEPKREVFLMNAHGVLDTREPKQETLEEAAEKYVNSFEFGIAHPRRVCKNTFINGAKWQTEQNNTSKINRVEVIQHSEPYNGRAYTNYNAKDVEIQFQDDGKTLKIFLK